ncbi:MAG TPA: DinB family protein [Bryobacteraceae bacterium]|nr:DinB family protein [Bryobacteraceae bacterium]
MSNLIGRPDQSEAAKYYFTYIDQAPGADAEALLLTQVEDLAAFFSAISEEKSLHRYAPGKWSIRQVLNHINDTERAFAFRALWFARGFETPLPSYEQGTAATGAEADRFSWAAHVEEFRCVRRSTISLFANMPPEARMRRGIASGNPFTVRSLAWIIAGHAAHHSRILRERYL